MHMYIGAASRAEGASGEGEGVGETSCPGERESRTGGESGRTAEVSESPLT